MPGDVVWQEFRFQVKGLDGWEWRTERDRVVVVAVEGDQVVVTDPKGAYGDVDTGDGPGRWRVALGDLSSDGPPSLFDV